MHMAGFLVGASLFLLAPLALAQAPSFDGLKPLIQGGSEAIEGEARVEDGRILADDEQSGANYALAQILEQNDGDGALLIVVPSGLGVLAVATEPYRTYDNVNATLLSKRAAYMKALARAQNELVAHAGGLDITCKTLSLPASLQAVDTGSDTLAAERSSLEEDCAQTVQGLLQGYVTYAVKDDALGEKTVTVALASTPRTRAAAHRLGPSVIETEDMEGVWDSLMAEIMAGTVPPVGARLITNPATGEDVVVGFGSAIVRQNKDPALARSLRRAAREQAQMRANNALLGFLQGTRLLWNSGFDEKQIEEASQLDPAEFERFREANTLAAQAARAISAMAGKIKEGRFAEAPAAATEALAAPPAGGEEAIAVDGETRTRFLNTLSFSTAGDFVTSGRLPPGIKSSAFTDESGHWALALAVYSQSMTAQAEQAAGDAAAGGVAAPEPAQGPVMQQVPLYGGANEAAPNPPGPSGQVTKDKDL